VTSEKTISVPSGDQPASKAFKWIDALPVRSEICAACPVWVHREERAPGPEDDHRAIWRPAPIVVTEAQRVIRAIAASTLTM